MDNAKSRVTKSVLIEAPVERVWDVLLNDTCFSEWASIFCEGSYAETDQWKEKTTVHFKNGDGCGLVSEIVLHQPGELIVFKHTGILNQGREDFDSDEAKKWIGKQESYRVERVLDKTNLEINQDIEEEYFGWFSETWDKALVKIKELCEK